MPSDIAGTGRAAGRMSVVSRTTAALLGGYCFVWGVITLGTAAGMRLGMSYGDAQVLLYLLAFPIFTAAFCWAFHMRGLPQVWAVFVGGGLLMMGLGWLLAGR